MDEARIRSQLKTWIVEHTKAPKPVVVEDDTRILEKGILSSLDVVEFVLFIESLRGEEVDTDAIEPEAFASVDALYRFFFASLGS